MRGRHDVVIGVGDIVSILNFFCCTPWHGLVLNGKGKHDGQKKWLLQRFSVALPPPNVTGSLHLGHALTGSIQVCPWPLGDWLTNITLAGVTPPTKE
jgi:hypothetical protein